MMMPGRKYQAGAGFNYRFSINGQEKESDLNENITTALFWEYDSRIGRRWNVDPKPNISLSPYSTFGNNPIYNSDALGDTTINGQKMEGQNSASASTLPEIVITKQKQKPIGVDPKRVVQINTNVKCHPTNLDSYVANANSFANAASLTNNGRGLDIANGQLYLPINPILNFIIGGRVDYSQPSIGTGHDVSADGYVSKKNRPFGGTVPGVGIKGGELAAFWPKNGGALEEWYGASLIKGARVDRIGGLEGSYLAPYGTPFSMRALPVNGTYRAFEVLKPFQVEVSTTAPAFGQMGLGTQYRTPISVNYLLEFGYLKGIK